MVDLGGGSAREDPFGGRARHVVMVDSLLLLLFRRRSVGAASFSKSEFEIGICIEIGILPEPSEAKFFF